MANSERTDASPDRSARKRAAILDAAQEIFLRDGYLGASMDEVASRSGVSKQTVYAHFGRKESLFVEVVESMTLNTGSEVHRGVPAEVDADTVESFLSDYAARQLLAVVTPRVMRLRRLVIGEVGRFPDLARVLYEQGPRLAVTQLASVFTTLAERGVLRIDDPETAAEQFNWLVMGEPLNRAMLLGDDGIPGPERLRAHAAGAARTFLAATRTGQEGVGAPIRSGSP